MQVVNQGQVNYEYQIAKDQPIIKKTHWSNSVRTLVLDKRIEVLKQADKKVATVYEEITYTITVCNVSSLTIKNLFFKDDVPNELQFIHNTVSIDGIKKRCISPIEGFEIGHLIPGGCRIISFKSVVLPRSEQHRIENWGRVDYDYIYNIELPAVTVTVNSNKIATVIERRIFNQFSHETKLIIPYKYPLIDKLQWVRVITQPIETKLINNSYGNNVLLIGELCYQIQYIRKKHEKVQSWMEEELFSCLLKVPDGVKYCATYPAKITLEDVMSYVINTEEILIAMQLLISIF